MSPQNRQEALIITALELFAGQCCESGHAMCDHTGACLDALDAQAQKNAAAACAARFDASGSVLSKRTEEPSSTWSTSELLRTVLDRVLTPPNIDWLWRSITITSALARLGERGLSPDAVLRTGFGRDLRRRILRDATAFWLAERDGSLTRDDVPAFLRGWVDLLDAEPALDSNDLTTTWTGQAVLPLSLADSARQWLRSAAVGHLVSWKISDFLAVRPGPDELVFPGGKDATRWVCDRLARTYLSEWSPASLQWELAYIRMPGKTCARAGVDPAILEERVCVEDMVVEELCHQVHTPEAHTEVDGDTMAEDLVPSLALMLRAGQLDAARTLARRAYEGCPSSPQFELAYAFCSIPTDRAESRRVLKLLDASAEPARTLIFANMAVCELFDGHTQSAQEWAAKISSPLVSDAVWLWDPVQALRGGPEVNLEPIGLWLERLHAAADQST